MRALPGKAEEGYTREATLLWAGSRDLAARRRAPRFAQGLGDLLQGRRSSGNWRRDDTPTATGVIPISVPRERAAR